LQLEHDAETHIDALAAVGHTLVLRLGDHLARFDGARRIALDGMKVDPGTHLAAVGTVLWLLGPTEARRVKLALHTPHDTWETIAPVVAHSCGTCHRPGGKGGFDLTTEDAWRTRRDEIVIRVIEQRDMPPSSAPQSAQLTDAERDLVRRWLKK
jgi:hypothetical protein